MTVGVKRSQKCRLWMACQRPWSGTGTWWTGPWRAWTPRLRASLAWADGVLAGFDVAQAVFLRVDAELQVQGLLADGAALSPGSDIARIEGSAGSILRAERIALNFMQRMSGIASDTRLS